MSREPTGFLTADRWDAFLASFPDAHLLQTTAWGELKAAFGWEAVRLQRGSAGAQVLFRRLATGLQLAYVPKGPVGEWLPDLLPDIDAVCRARRAFALKIEPDSPDEPSRVELLAQHGFRPSSHTIQPRRTLIVDLRGDEDSLLARMHPKTRYNIRLAQKKGVRVRPWDDLPAFARMMHETAARDRFAAHAPAYYQRAFDLFRPTGACELLVAEVEGQPVAALMVFAHGRRAWYFYGASTAHERPRMPAYLLQWEAMLWARARGCSQYDLWGIPDVDEETLEAEFTSRRDGLWGVYRFKRGFGGKVVRNSGAWDRPYNPVVYKAYDWFLKAAGRAGLP
ncbi:MAG: peptidoglycan bridge formation glycyltransferase FemA/FemB family protein [Chloroflexota bacterium]